MPFICPSPQLQVAVHMPAPCRTTRFWTGKGYYQDMSNMGGVKKMFNHAWSWNVELRCPLKMLPYRPADTNSRLETPLSNNWIILVTWTKAFTFGCLFFQSMNSLGVSSAPWVSLQAFLQYLGNRAEKKVTPNSPVEQNIIREGIVYLL